MTNRATGVLAPKRSLSYLTTGPKHGPARDFDMHPFRAFLLSFMLGSFVLFGGYGLRSAMTPPKTDHTITV